MSTATIHTVSGIIHSISLLLFRGGHAAEILVRLPEGGTTLERVMLTDMLFARSRNLRCGDTIRAHGANDGNSLVATWLEMGAVPGLPIPAKPDKRDDDPAWELFWALEDVLQAGVNESGSEASAPCRTASRRAG